MSITAVEIAAWMSDYFGATISDTDTEFVHALKDTLVDLSDRPEGDLLQAQDTSLATSANTITVSLSTLTGLKRIELLQLIDDDTNASRCLPLEEVTYAALMTEKAGESSSDPANTDRPVRYAVYNGSLYLDPTPDVAYALVTDYTKRHARSATIEYGDEFFAAIAHGTYYRFLLSKDQPDRATDFKGLYEQAIERLIGTHRPTPPRQTKYHDV